MLLVKVIVGVYYMINGNVYILIGGRIMSWLWMSGGIFPESGNALLS
ncbi:hypothetical protein PDESU_06063 [Pontiella desulfatans]|uniref:Uncharacterized protein n=1 Tax=Pontiella desulfatans TaxID=2750659 RepID=A0A6C2UD34_PONDE|nr:hypothetical protein PDESU_06063 [Pontiella desulfatans]